MKHRNAIGAGLRHLASRERMRQVAAQYTPGEIDLWGRVLVAELKSYGMRKSVRHADKAVVERRIRERMHERAQQHKQGVYR